jgi:plasmid stabilization system protein ParE
LSQRLVIDEEAEDELEAARDWYERQRPGLGDELLEAVDEAVRRIGTSAGTIVPCVAGDLPVRQVLVRRYPYAVVYLETDDELRILAFAHAKRRPGYWLGRA